MVQQQGTPGTSDVPKRSFFRNLGKKQIIYIVLPLLVINAGILHTVVAQIALSTGTYSSQVKDETTSIDAANEATSDQSVEQEIVPVPEEEQEPSITTYIVKNGDTIGGIAAKFGISTNTVLWANDLTGKSKIKPGDELVILPVTGIGYTVKKGDTLSGIAAKFDADQEDILKYNDIEKDAIKTGTELIIPGAEPVKAPAPKPAPAKTSTTQPTTKPTSTTSPSTKSDSTGSRSDEGYTTPVRGILTQGTHDVNAVDFGVPTATQVVAFKAGTVIVAKGSGYNGGYGSYIVIDHEGTCQTQYSHLSKVSVSVGDTVSQGQAIGLSGNTGRSTGPHLHFNARNCGGNPFAKYKVGTRF